MFKVSTKGDYGLLVLAAIAEKMKAGTERVSLKEIASAKHLSLPYISQIIVVLKKAGLVKSKEGRGGGYRLAKPTNEISMLEVLEALEGPIAPVRCCSDSGKKCGSEPYCNVKFAWHDAGNMLTEFLRKRTLADTIEKISYVSN